jgi:O-antigen ligase
VELSVTSFCPLPILAGLMNREVLDRWCELGILGLVLAILVFGPLAFGAVDPPELIVIQGLTMGVMALWCARLWLVSRPRFLCPPISWVVVAFVIYSIARYFTADIEYIARQELIKVLIYAFLFLAIVNNLHRQESTQIICFALISLAMLIAGYAIFQFLTDSNHVWRSIKPYPHRGSGTYLSPNHLGGFLEMLLPLGLAYTITSRLKAVSRVFLGYASLVILAGIAVTVSRGSWISTILALAIFFGVVMMQGRHWIAASLLLCLILAGGVFLAPRSAFFQTRARQLVSGGKVDDDKRFALWQPAFRLWTENLWWGVGPGHFDVRFRAYRPEVVQERPEQVHNDYLNTLTDLGLVGGILVAAALVLLGMGVAKTWPVVRGTPRDLGQTKTSNKFAFVLGSSVGLTALLFHSVVDFNMHIPANAILAITLMALLSSHLRFATERYWTGANTALKVLATVVLLAGIACLGQQARQHGLEYAALKSAWRAPRFSPGRVKWLKKAFEIDPKNAETAYNIGEAYRIQSQAGGQDYQEQAKQAMEWFDKSSKLNKWDARNPLHYGLCLDWLERTGESGPFFDRAEQLDPNSYFTLNCIGKHYVEAGDIAASRPWFERSLRLQWENNPMARNYLQMVNDRLTETATNEISAKLAFPAK